MELRLRFLAEHRAVPSAPLPDAFRTTTREFFLRHEASRTSLSWLAEQDGVAVGVVSMLLLDLAPRPDDLSGRDGYVINMYVEHAHRRCGVGRKLLGAILDGAAELGLRRLVLSATDDGRQLYERAGFRPNANWLELTV